MSPLEKLIMKKKEQGIAMDPLEKQAKMGNLHDLIAEMSGMMKGDLAPKKVEISASASPDAIPSDGADSAAIGDAPDMGADDGEESPAHEGLEDPGEEDSETMQAKLSPDEMALLQKLMMKMKA